MSWKKHVGKKVFEFIVPKPKPGKSESTKVWSQKLRGKFKKELEEASNGIDKALKDTGQLLQKIKKIPITKDRTCSFFFFITHYFFPPLNI